MIFLFLLIGVKCWYFALSSRLRHAQMWINLYARSRCRVALRSSRQRERPAGAHACSMSSTPRVRPVRVACKVEIRRTTPYYVVPAKWAGTDGSAAPASEADPWLLAGVVNPVNLPRFYLAFNVATSRWLAAADRRNDIPINSASSPGESWVKTLQRASGMILINLRSCANSAPTEIKIERVKSRRRGSLNCKSNFFAKSNFALISYMHFHFQTFHQVCVFL